MADVRVRCMAAGGRRGRRKETVSTRTASLWPKFSGLQSSGRILPVVADPTAPMASSRGGCIPLPPAAPHRARPPSAGCFEARPATCSTMITAGPGVERSWAPLLAAQRLRRGAPPRSAGTSKRRTTLACDESGHG
jgi:hypothetical protein